MKIPKLPGAGRGAVPIHAPAPADPYAGVANFDLPDQQGFTPLMQALISRQSALAQTLIENGARLDVRSHCGLSPLLIAAGEGDVAAVALMLQKGGRLEDRDAMGYTALMRAVCANRIDTVHLLLQGGANLHALGPNRASLLHLAVSFAGPEVALLLLRAGIAFDVIDGGGMTPLQLAQVRGNKLAWHLITTEPQRRVYAADMAERVVRARLMSAQAGPAAENGSFQVPSSHAQPRASAGPQPDREIDAKPAPPPGFLRSRPKPS